MTLSAPELGDFEGAAGDVARAIELTPADTDTLVERALAELASSQVDLEELHRRVRRLIDLLPRTPAVDRALAMNARSASAEVKAAVVAQLTGEFRRLVYSADGPDDVTSEPQRSAREVSSEESADIIAEHTPADDWSTVLLLGERQDVESNARLLESRGLVPITVGTLEKREALLVERVCGVVVHKSWRSVIPSGETLATFLRSELEQANVIYYVMDIGDLEAADSIPLNSVLDGCDAHVRANIRVTDGCNLMEVDLLQLQRTAILLSSSEATGVTLDSLSAHESRVLATSVAMFEEVTRGVKPERALEVSASPLSAGRSSAKVFRVTVDGGRSVVVAKFDAVAKLQAEMVRARLLTPTAQLLPMAVYCLGGVAVLIQQLVADADHVSAAAPSLKERLSALSAWEGGRTTPPPPAHADLLLGLERAFEVIKYLNALPVVNQGKECWTGTEPIEAMSGLGIEWVLEADDGEFNAKDPLEFVSAKVTELETATIVHGDLHAGNVLLPDDRVPRLIDFAQAGAGHPAFDLVRLSSAIAYGSLRPVVLEKRMRAYFAAVHLTETSAADLETQFGDVLAAQSARLANAALVLARDAARTVLPSGDSGHLQYLAMVYLIGLQSLTRAEFQAGVVRSALGAIKPGLSIEAS